MLCIYNGDAVFDWDDNNLRKIRAHRIKRGAVEEALSNSPILIYEQSVGGEPRFVYYGESGAGRLLAVVLTERGYRIRVSDRLQLGCRTEERLLCAASSREIDDEEDDHTTDVCKRGRRGRLVGQSPGREFLKRK
jgi:uncharacterized DUF497 family protein